MGVYYPSLVVNMQLRFDESFSVIEDDSPTALSPTDIEQGKLLFFKPPQVRPLLASGSKDQLTQVSGRIPKSGSVELNGYRQAHTFDLTFDFRDIPIDPRIIRDARIEIFLGVVQPANFARGMVSTTLNPDGSTSRPSIISTQLSSTNATNLLFVGTIDEAEVSHTDKGSLVNLKGRDLRGILIDAKADPRIFRDLKLNVGIDDVVRQIISKVPFMPHTNVYAHQDEWPNKVIPSPATVDGVTRVRLGANGKQSPLSSPQGPGDKIGFWDLITKYCNLVGAVPFLVGKDISVRPINSLYSQQRQGMTGMTPFAGGKPRVITLNGTTTQIPIRSFVYGRDITNLKFSRKYRGQKTPVIEVISIDTGSSQRGLQKMIIARWPVATGSATAKQLAAAKKTSVAPSGQVSQTDVLRFPIAGIKSKTVLQTIAQNLYQEIGRNELGISVSTKDFASFNTDQDQDPDMLKIQPGDAVQIFSDRRALSSQNPLVSELSDQSRMTFAQQVAFIAKQTGDQNLARVIVSTLRGRVVGLQDTFRVKNVKYTLSEGGAVGIDFDAENYIEVRSDAVNPKIPQITTAATGKSTP